VPINAESTACAAETLYREGKLSSQEIAGKLKISKSTLYSYLRHRGVPYPTRSIALFSSRVGKMVGRGVECRGRRKGQVRTIPVGVSFRFPHRLTTSG
jgi:hypothetical protein